jgi:hypothetical protein
MRRLVQALGSDDDRVAVAAAGMILDRALGRPREQAPEAQREAEIDLSALNSSELQVLAKLVSSGRLRSAPVAELPPDIEGEATEK